MVTSGFTTFDEPTRNIGEGLALGRISGRNAAAEIP